jgi:hypothetical protein
MRFSRVPGLPKDLRNLIKECLHTLPRKRPSSKSVLERLQAMRDA